MDSALKRSRFWMIVVGFFTFVLVVSLIVEFFTTPLHFDSEDWRQRQRLRPRMVDDLLASHKLKGMSRNEVDHLLGKPTGQDSIRNNRYIYWAGHAGIDDMWLDLRFQNNLVVEFSLYPD